MKNIVLKFIPEKYTIEPEVFRKARLFVSTCFITSFFSSFYLFTSYLADMNHVFGAMVFNLLGFVLLPFVFKTDKIPLKILANTYIAIGAIGVTITVFYTGGLISSVLPWLAVLPIASLMLIDKKSGWVWTIITYVTITAVGALKINGYQFEDETNESILYIFNTSNLNGLGVLIFLIATVFENTRNSALKKLEDKKKLLDEKHKEITDSIEYAQRIQEAILPSTKMLTTNLNNGYILYKPKDIVSGDFYWLEKIGDMVLFAAADCTGHGVPGAMVSVVCVNALNRSVREFELTDPAKILDKTRELVIATFEQGDHEVKDGMDISLCALNKKTNELLWAGANNPLWVVRKNAAVIEETKPDKQAIGKCDNPKAYTSHRVQLNAGDSVYVFTDGYQDQFGGVNGKKFKIKQLRQTILNICGKPLEDQERILDHTFDIWKEGLEQVDDVCVIGVKI